MTDAAQADAYAAADFSEPNRHFVRLFAEHVSPDFTGRVCDLGCGPAEIPLLLAEEHPAALITGVDGSKAMLASGAARYAGMTPWARVHLVEAMLPVLELQDAPFDAVISNSLLHHLHTPEDLWRSIRALGDPGAPVLVMDLFRPQNSEAARAIVQRYAEGEPEVLRTDFYNSLLAAFTPAEVTAQLAEAGMAGLRVSTVSDRHLLIYGCLPG